MDICGTYKILSDGDFVGEMNVYTQGMLTIFEGSCQPDREGPFRVAALSEGYLIMLGVMLPHDEGYYIRRSFSKNAMAELGIKEITEFRLVYPEMKEEEEEPETAAPEGGWRKVPEPWKLFRDEELSDIIRDVKGAMQYCDKNGDILFAVPLERGVPFPAMPIFCFGTYLKINDKSYVVFRLRDGIIIQ